MTLDDKNIDQEIKNISKLEHFKFKFNIDEFVNIPKSVSVVYNL